MGKVFWLTGLSGSGKSTLCNRIVSSRKSHRIINLDGDLLREGLNSDLGFDLDSRTENIRRSAELAKLFLNEEYSVLVSFISPLQKHRDLARNIIGTENFYEIFISTNIDECIKRDPKGLYKKVREGLIKDFTGVDSPYEAPLKPDLTIDTSMGLDKSIEILLDFVCKQDDNLKDTEAL